MRWNLFRGDFKPEYTQNPEAFGFLAPFEILGNEMASSRSPGRESQYGLGGPAVLIYQVIAC